MPGYHPLRTHSESGKIGDPNPATAPSRAAKALPKGAGARVCSQTIGTQAEHGNRAEQQELGTTG